MNKISEEASKLTDEDWVGIEDQFNKLQETPAEAEVQFAKNGAKLNNLKRLQKHKSQKTAEPKKCSCGCTMIDKKEKGGKVVSTCSCGCSNKKEEGGSINNPKDTETKLNSATKVFKIYQKMKALKIK